MDIAKKRDIRPLSECDFIINLGKTLDELEISRNALAVNAQIRPLTINQLVVGKPSQINFSTLQSILEALNRIAEEKGIDRNFTVSDVFEYKITNKDDGE